MAHHVIRRGIFSGAGGGGGVAPGAGGLRFSRNGSTAVGTPLRIDGGAQLQFVGRSYAIFTAFSVQDFVWWGLTNDGTTIGVEIRHGREVGGVLTIVQNQIVNVPSAVQQIRYSASLSAPFIFEPGDYLFVRIVASTDGGTATNVTNCSIQFKVEA